MPRPITKMALQSSNVVISLEEGQESLPDSLLATPGGPQLLQTISDEAARADSMDGGESVIDVESTTDSMVSFWILNKAIKPYIGTYSLYVFDG